MNIANSIQRMSLHGIVANVVEKQDEILSRIDSNGSDIRRGPSMDGFKHLQSNDKRSEVMDNEVFEHHSGRPQQKVGDISVSRQESVLSNSIRKSDPKS